MPASDHRSGNGSENRVRLAVDIGGTFTDVVLERADGERFTTKLLTTYDHPGKAVIEGIQAVIDKAGASPADVGLIVHGTTLATNALIERRGAITALLTTEGHRDTLAMAHEDRFEQYDINIDRPAPLVPRYLRLPVTERLDRDGNILIPLDESSVEACLPVLESHGVESVAIGYLHGFINPAHEQSTAAIISRTMPGVSISLASEVAPEIREFERLSTTCANAYVKPLMHRYLTRLSGELKALGYQCPFFLMTSGGGLTTLETASRFPIRLVESGPAGGAILAQHIAAQLAVPRMLSFDMGGTTAKLCLIDDGQALTSRSFEVDRVYRFKKGSGLPVRIPVIEMVEIGAGGGSIASVDRLQRIQIGPESAGSEPGPAVYNRGGQQATVTDADVVLGRIPIENFAAGAFSLNPDAGVAAITQHIANPLGLSAEAAAFGISEVVDENMTAAARAHAAEFGMDVSDRTIVAFGGAAPLHACRLADKLGANRLIIPNDAGVGSAVGFLIAPVSYEVVRSRQQRLENLDTHLVNSLFTEMLDEATDIVKQGTDTNNLVESREATMRYVGQGHELTVTLPTATFKPEDAQLLRELFEKAYQQLYGHVIDGVEVEVLSWLLTVSEPNKPAEAIDQSALTEGATAPAVAHQPMFDPVRQETVSAPVYQRDSLATGAVIKGPALITEPQTTCVINANFSVTCLTDGSLEILRNLS